MVANVKKRNPAEGSPCRALRKVRSDGAATRDRLISVAIELMAERGEESVSLVDVAHRAKVTRGTVYHHFRTRDALLAEIKDNLDQHLIRLADGSRVFERPYVLVPNLAAEGIPIIQMRVRRWLQNGPWSDPALMALIKRFKEFKASNTLREGIDAEMAAIYSVAANTLGAAMAVSGGKTPKARHALALRFAKTARQAAFFGIFDPYSDPTWPEIEEMLSADKQKLLKRRKNRKV